MSGVKDRGKVCINRGFFRLNEIGRYHTECCSWNVLKLQSALGLAAGDAFGRDLS